MTLPPGIPGIGARSMLSVWRGGGGDVADYTTYGAWGSFSAHGGGGGA